MKNKTLIIGASANPTRYAYMALTQLLAKKHQVLAIGKKEEQVLGVNVASQPILTTEVDTVTLYLNATNQKPYYDYILSLHPRRIIFNPGTENDELMDLAQKNGIFAMEACTLVMLSTGQY
jgi:hypothetical protein